jgi:hypothetical protein
MTVIKLSHLSVSILDEDTVLADNLGESRDKICSKHHPWNYGGIHYIQVV